MNAFIFAALNQKNREKAELIKKRNEFLVLDKIELIRLPKTDLINRFGFKACLSNRILTLKMRKNRKD